MLRLRVISFGGFRSAQHDRGSSMKVDGTNLTYPA